MSVVDLNKLKSQLLEIRDPSQRLPLLKRLATLAYEYNDEDAESIAFELLVISQKLNNVESICTALLVVAEVRLQAMKVSLSDEAYIDELIQYSTAHLLPTFMVKAWYLKSSYQLGRSALKEALHSINIASKILAENIQFDDDNFTVLELNILYQRSSILYRTATNYAEALQLAITGLEKSTLAKNAGLQTCFLQSLALITGKMEDYEASIGYINRIINLEEAQSGHMTLLGAYRFKASMYEQLNDFSGAEAAYLEAARYADILNDDVSRFYISSKRIPILINQHRLEDAKILAVELLSLIADKRVIRGEAEIHFFLADIAKKQNKPHEAVEILEQNKQLFIEKEDKLLLQKTTALLHDAYYLCGEYNMAYKTLLEHQELIKNIFDVEKSKEYTLLHTKFETKEKETQLKQLQIDNLNSELRLLKSQMNPHFMFNAIGSVSNLMQSGKIEEAHQSLLKFSRLMRSTLEQSQGDEILIEDEIEFLDSYLHLEKNILGDSFTYSFQIDENIDTSYNKIPSLILQPIVENALKHGLRTKDGEKKLLLQFILKDDEGNQCIQITISDNGIGRAASAELNKNRIKHQSFATKSIEDRIKIINANAGMEKIKLRIIDLAEGNIALGTCAELSIYL